MGWFAARSRSQSFSVIEFSQAAIKGSKREMSGFPGNLQNEAIGKAKRWLAAKVSERSRNNIRILERDTRVIHKHLDSDSASVGIDFVN
jgi:hypothetical protein